MALAVLFALVLYDLAAVELPTEAAAAVEAAALAVSKPPHNTQLVQLQKLRQLHRMQTRQQQPMLPPQHKSWLPFPRWKLSSRKTGVSQTRELRTVDSVRSKKYAGVQRSCTARRCARSKKVCRRKGEGACSKEVRTQ